MNLSFGDQILQMVAWALALVEITLALYVLLLNAWHPANRHVSVLLLFTGIDSLALGWMVTATDAAQATIPTKLAAAASPTIQLWVLLVTIVLLNPQWAEQRHMSDDPVKRVWIWLSYGMGVLPIALTVLDTYLGTRLYYTGLDPDVYKGGFVDLSEYAAGALAGPIRALYFGAFSIAVFVPILYVILRDRDASPRTRWLARLLGISNLVAVGIVLALGIIENVSATAVAALAASAIYTVTYGYVTFQQMISERRLQRGRLQTRLSVLVLGIVLPLIIGVTAFVGIQAGELITDNALDRLRATNRSLASSVSVWLDLNSRALQELVSLPGMASMQVQQQKPLLERMATAYPYMNLVSTVSLSGESVARSDGGPSQEYGDRLWHIGARNGAPVTYEVAIDRSSGRPTLVVSTPIRRESGTIVGVAMFSTALGQVTREVQASMIGETGFAYAIDGQNQVVAHPDPTFANTLHDYNTYPPVMALRGGARGSLTFSDEQGQSWQAFVETLDNGWGVVTQQTEAELLGGLARLRLITIGVIVVGGALLSALVWLTIRQAMQGVERLTATATAVASGELERRAQVESDDEIGALAGAFNSMTEQLHALITGLEERVAARTRDLERRTIYLEAATEVSRAAASILNTDQLIRQVVEVIRDQFNLYYVGLFLMDEAERYAVLRAGTGEAGRAMLARRHRIELGKGMIGWSISNGQPRVAREVGEDQVRLTTAELPKTRSEAAIPLRSRGQVLGAVTVQDTQANAFDEMAIAALQTMADQVAVALDNARLFDEAQLALEAERRAYGELDRQAWAELIQASRLQGFRSDERGVTPLVEKTDGQRDIESAASKGRGQVSTESDDGHGLPAAIPIKIRDQVIGILEAYKPASSGKWSQDEMILLEQLAEQVNLALEGARLYQQSQRRAAQEQLISHVTSQMRQTLDIESVLRTAADEIYQALELEEVTISFTPEGQDGL